MQHTDKIPDLDKVPLLAGWIYYDWSDVPQHFRMVLNRDKLLKLIRNSDKVRVYCASLYCEVVPQKASIMSEIKSLECAAHWQFAATFNGLDLLIIGAVEDESAGETQDWLDAFAGRSDA